MAYSVEGLGPPWGGSDGPAAPFGKCWLSPGEESEGNMADWTQSPHPEDRVPWGSWRRLGGRSYLDRNEWRSGQICSRDEARDLRGKRDSDMTECIDWVGVSEG